ncbi:protein kinase domain-containing protein [Ktedonobacter racemifer]|uniref:Serine/threonine protein kinase n=1 Tax=Ktedonobacter racemifer DSM 44963 TaxID=485913 RepID=D6TE97_KTERA|nr:protein kinase [Ktedonobacter racemifer]EFH90270.1 serine/threonine protein kinase [Ktedonobacter racemifer DSM 44963]
MAYCLNPRGTHSNPPDAVCCQHCDFLVQGSHIGSYEIMAFIGAGSYGQVYKIREPAPLSRTLALKVLRLDQLTAKAQASFFQEARRIAAMHHPNILPVYNFGQLTGNERPYLVTEYAPQTILDLFRREDGTRRLAFAEELIPYIHQTASALQYVHNNGLVHQDVKPGNLLIGRNGQVLLADFGTTFYLGMQTHASLGEITGTAAYMPLEQWQGTPRRDSDQYALAICCYELLTGRTPFVYKRLEEMWYAHAGEQPMPPHQLNMRIPSEVSAVLMRALAKNYRQRYNSISDFARSYTQAVQIALQRYVCQRCGQQNRSGAARCSFCGAEYDNRRCPYCEAPVRFGQRCCSQCGRLTVPAAMVPRSPLIGVTLRQGRYAIKHVLKQSEESNTMVAIATDERQNDQRVVLKRWECSDLPLAQRARDVAHYDHVTEPLTRLRHPLVPRVLDRFAEGRHYYLVLSYINGESIEERLQKLLRPIPEAEVRTYMLAVLNILIALEQQQPIVRHYDLSPANIIIEQQRNRVHLTGFQVPPPLQSAGGRLEHGKRTTRKLVISPYLPIQDKPYDIRTCIYALAASMHHAITNVAPPHYPTYPPVRMLNPNVSAEFEAILSRALAEDPQVRYQSYASLKQDLLEARRY